MKSRCEQTTCSWIGGWRYCIFFLHMPCFIDLFLLIMNMFFWKYLQIMHIYIYNTMLHLFCILWYVLLVMGRFFCNLHAYSAYLQYMEDTGRSKMRQKNWSFRGFRTKYLGLECPSGIFPRYSLRQCKCWLNGMVTSKKRHYTQTLLHLSNIL